MTPWHEHLDTRVRAAGYFANGYEPKDGWGRVTISSKPQSGNSFWATCIGGVWYLGTWRPRIYRLPDGDRVGDLAAAWFERQPDKTRHDFDEEVIGAFGLIEISDEDFDKVVLRDTD